MDTILGTELWVSTQLKGDLSHGFLAIVPHLGIRPNADAVRHPIHARARSPPPCNSEESGVPMPA